MRRGRRREEPEEGVRVRRRGLSWVEASWERDTVNAAPVPACAATNSRTPTRQRLNVKAPVIF